MRNFGWDPTTHFGCIGEKYVSDTDEVGLTAPSTSGSLKRGFSEVGGLQEFGTGQEGRVRTRPRRKENRSGTFRSPSGNDTVVLIRDRNGVV